jgi:FKBP-type peptidyl-prolyl cis-trans isomerase
MVSVWSVAAEAARQRGAAAVGVRAHAAAAVNFGDPCMKRLITILAAVLSMLMGGRATAQPATPANPERMLPADLQYVYVRLNTNHGSILLELDNKKAPVTTSNFVMYVEDGHYNGTIFHRVINSFMIQGGGFTTDFVQKPTRAPIRNEWRNNLSNTRGTIAMARLGGQADSATAQFFINVVDNQALNLPRDGAGYAVFGKVIEGMDVVDKIRAVRTHTTTVDVGRTDPATGKVTSAKQTMQDVPVEPVIIESAERLDPATIADKIAAIRAEEEAAAKAADQARKAAHEKAMNEGLQWLAKNHNVDPSTVIKHESGLWSVVVTPGDGSKTPGPADRVTVHYTGWLTNGTKFDSSRDRGEPITFALNRVIRGWTEGVGYMSPGERRFLIIPSDLGYGERGAPPSIPGNAVLVFDVELLELPG